MTFNERRRRRPPSIPATNEIVQQDLYVFRCTCLTGTRPKKTCYNKHDHVKEPFTRQRRRDGTHPPWNITTNDMAQQALGACQATCTHAKNKRHTTTDIHLEAPPTNQVQNYTTSRCMVMLKLFARQRRRRHPPTHPPTLKYRDATRTLYSLPGW